MRLNDMNRKIKKKDAHPPLPLPSSSFHELLIQTNKNEINCTLLMSIASLHSSLWS
jgi:hypothetical protein